MSNAYACLITKENLSSVVNIIASEKPGFDLEELKGWLEMHGRGYFIRDEGSPWDCTYMNVYIFHEVYARDTPEDQGEIFRRIRRI